MEKINIAFCFDKNLWRQFCVSAASLLSASKNECAYDIYAVVSDDVDEEIKRKITGVVAKFDTNSTITFLTANHDFDNHEPNRPAGYFYRIQLIEYAPVDKIVYADIDTVFTGDLSELYHTDMRDNLVCGVLDGLNMDKCWPRLQKKTDNRYLVEKGKYINSGVMLMNLKRLREENLYPEFLKLVGEKLRQQDQCMLNFVCRDRIGLLPLKYNFTPKSASRKYKTMVKEGLFSKEELDDAVKNAPLYHFMACAPWKKITKGADIWWEYARRTGFYEDLKRVFYQQANICHKIKFFLMSLPN